MADILKKLNISQLKELIEMFCIEPPHSKSTKQDIISHILNSEAKLDEKMLAKHFALKPFKKEVVSNTENEVKKPRTRLTKEPNELRQRRTKKNTPTEVSNPFTSAEILDQIS